MRAALAAVPRHIPLLSLCVMLGGGLRKPEVRSKPFGGEPCEGRRGSEQEVSPASALADCDRF